MLNFAVIMTLANGLALSLSLSPVYTSLTLQGCHGNILVAANIHGFPFTAGHKQIGLI